MIELTRLKKTLLIHHHMGVGDSIICNGLVRSLLTNSSYFSDIIVCSWAHNQKTIKRMYDDDNRIHVLPISENTDEVLAVNNFVNENKICNFIRCGFGLGDNLIALGLAKTFDEAFYLCVGVPYENQWKQFYYRRDFDKEESVLKKLNPTNEPFMFVHDAPYRGYTLDVPNPNGFKVIKNDMSESIFDMGRLLESAQEIHCMESSFRVLIDHLPVTCPLYFYPKIRAVNGSVISPMLKKMWTTVN